MAVAEVVLSENELRQIRVDKLTALQNAGKDPFEITTATQTHESAEIKADYDALEGKDVNICGRIMTWRDMGKANFIDVQDREGRIQVYVRMNDIGEAKYAEFKKWDIGDIVEVNGFVFKTRTGEISVHAKTIRLLSKSLLPLPEKFHGLTDTDTRYRKRYLDMIMNPGVKDAFIKRSKIITSIRNYLDSHGFIEVETPMLNTIPGGAAARPFITHHNTLNLDMYLRIATELYLKRLIVGGMERVYEIGRNFRNEGMDVRHNPEFTCMELYQAYTDYHGMMDIAEALIRNAANDACGTLHITYCGTDIDLETPFARMTMIEAVQKYSGVDFAQFMSDDEKAVALAKERALEVQPGKETWGDVLNTFFEEYVESNLVQPTFIMDYPVEISPLTKRKPDCPALTERFELFIMGGEYGNAYSELNDPIDQMKRFEAQMKLREAGDDEANMIDHDFVTALEYGMPPTGGLGIGIDRLVMLLTDSYSIRDVLLFPTMKPLNGVKDENGVSSEAVEAPKAEPEKIDFSKVEIEPLFKDFVDFETFSKSDFRAVKVLACEAVPKSKKLLKFTLDDGTGENRTILSGIHAYYEPEELVGKTCIAIVNLPPRPMMGIDSCGMLISAVHHEEGEEKLHLLMVDDHIPAGAKLY
ncbi:MAG TPA: lysine--tRNA ligase [Candidatus Eubacterium faecipullorum]|uniref:Lysine--tRNA ligase n=1 Tax=Candidatus Eubacterium faecipullorum TaxID=2838571 RepID=A0A9D1RDK8_9FIRM|nr:lysine--tRNA ligase [Candidatus Eubacterium faecipullorum]